MAVNLEKRSQVESYRQNKRVPFSTIADSFSGLNAPLIPPAGFRMQQG